MNKYNTNFLNKIAHLSLNKFDELPKTGKPSANEWTVLSSIVKYNLASDDFEVVALGTGSKCIGAGKMSPNGSILNDSHAEVICRRAFLRYLYYKINCALERDNKDLFEINENKKLRLNKNISFHFFTTHTPCGDASIFPKQNSEDFGNCLMDKGNSAKSNDVVKRSLDVDVESDVPNKKLKTSEDIFRTGAKCLANDPNQDLKLSGPEYHTTGVVRTKPGRGDPTLSVSCSDKIAKWTIVGIQGALLSFLLKDPIYLTSITIAGGVPYSEESIFRSIQTRFNCNDDLPVPYRHTIPNISQANCTFKYSKSDTKRPCPSSIIWSNVPTRALEVSVDGRKQGVTKKNREKKEGRLAICKKELFISFVDIITKHTELQLLQLKNLSYLQVKQEADEYNRIWELVKTNYFTIWTSKDKNLLSFFIDV